MGKFRSVVSALLAISMLASMAGCAQKIVLTPPSESTTPAASESTEESQSLKSLRLLQQSHLLQRHQQPNLQQHPRQRRALLLQRRAALLQVQRRPLQVLRSVRSPSPTLTGDHSSQARRLIQHSILRSLLMVLTHPRSTKR